MNTFSFYKLFCSTHLHLQHWSFHSPKHTLHSPHTQFRWSDDALRVPFTSPLFSFSHTFSSPQMCPPFFVLLLFTGTWANRQKQTLSTVAAVFQTTKHSSLVHLFGIFTLNHLPASNTKCNDFQRLFCFFIFCCFYFCISSHLSLLSAVILLNAIKYSSIDHFANYCKNVI